MRRTFGENLEIALEKFIERLTYKPAFEAVNDYLKGWDDATESAYENVRLELRGLITRTHLDHVIGIDQMSSAELDAVIEAARLEPSATEQLAQAITE